MDFTTQLLIAAISAGTPLLLATLGGILNERAGIIQLGAEGLMLMGAVTTCIVYIRSGNLLLALLATVAVTAVLGLLHSFLCVTLRANQTMSGLAMTLFGSGLSAYLGKPISGIPLPGTSPKLHLAWLENVPFIGKIFGNMDYLTWFSLLLVLALHLLIHRTSWGLHLRAVGDSPATADVMGIRVQLIRYSYVITGAALIGLAGADMVLAYAPTWNEGLTAGRGWIAVGLVIFARWNPLRALFCAYFFGALDSLGFRIQLLGSAVPPYFLKMIPYLVTILVLMYLGYRNRNKPSGTPEALGIPYIREQRF
ncbi:ABC transporter permease [Paenibacillus sp. FSL H8-0261]|jgi:general nucleoside transport system permease protein|uniref:ABC transporter permease n=1 Tax=Paenibacillus TaxID=44249 RepID=UPI00096FC711|nr:ABC transporter permease [Paenibacillus odorifer]OMC65087.1 ABC transporter permease [Paenibacillus odorifer]OMD56979.1 ABC transporter permease [Paenibacillus odorifer]